MPTLCTRLERTRYRNTHALTPGGWGRHRAKAGLVPRAEQATAHLRCIAACARRHGTTRNIWLMKEPCESTGAWPLSTLNDHWWWHAIATAKLQPRSPEAKKQREQSNKSDRQRVLGSLLPKPSHELWIHVVRRTRARAEIGSDNDGCCSSWCSAPWAQHTNTTET